MVSRVKPGSHGQYSSSIYQGISFKFVDFGTGQVRTNVALGVDLTGVDQLGNGTYSESQFKHIWGLTNPDRGHA